MLFVPLFVNRPGRRRDSSRRLGLPDYDVASVFAKDLSFFGQNVRPRGIKLPPCVECVGDLVIRPGDIEREEVELSLAWVEDED